MSPRGKKATKKAAKKAAPPIRWACKEHQVKEGGTCVLCRDQVPLFEVAEASKVRRAGG